MQCPPPPSTLRSEIKAAINPTAGTIGRCSSPSLELTGAARGCCRRPKQRRGRRQKCLLQVGRNLRQGTCAALGCQLIIGCLISPQSRIHLGSPYISHHSLCHIRISQCCKRAFPTGTRCAVYRVQSAFKASVRVCVCACMLHAQGLPEMGRDGCGYRHAEGFMAAGCGIDDSRASWSRSKSPIPTGPFPPPPALCKARGSRPNMSKLPPPTELTAAPDTAPP